MKPCLYFAYGSNLDAAQMKRRCPGAVAAGAATLRGYALAFGGYSRGWDGAVATVVPKRGGAVHGVLYEMPRADRDRLDRCEGHPFVYERVHVPVTDEQGRKRRAATYVLPRAAVVAPSWRYVAVILRAYAEHGFDSRPLLRAALSNDCWVVIRESDKKQRKQRTPDSSIMDGAA